MCDKKILVTVAEAADLLSIDVRSVYRLTSEGVLERRYVGKGTKQFRIPVAALREYAASLPTAPRA